MKKLTGKLFTRIGCVGASLMLFAGTACKTKTVDADLYPKTVLEDEEETEENIEVKENEESAFHDIDISTLLKTPPDTLKEKGVFEYNHYLMNPRVLEMTKDEPFAVMSAYEFLSAVVNFDTEFSLNPDFPMTDDDITLAQIIAGSANPVVNMVGFESEDNIHWTVKYCPKMAMNDVGPDEIEVTYLDGKSPEEAEKIYGKYVDYVTKMINENIPKDSTDIERAEIVYRKILEDFEIADYESMTAPEIEYKDGVSYYSIPSLVELVNAGSPLPEYMVPALYQAILLQLGVENEMVYGTGKFGDTGIESMKNVYSYQTYEDWIVITSGDESYHCDITMDMYAKADYMKSGAEGTYRPRFFGMSDEKRNETFEATSVATESGMAVPECPRDYYENRVSE